MADEFYLGLDPEIAIVVKKTGRIRSPHDIIYDPVINRQNGRLGAIGVDGDRASAPIEVRPGMSSSAEVLVDRMADLLNMMFAHYHPRGIAYRAGAWIEPEPLGFHIHLGWSYNPQPGEFDYNRLMFQVMEILSGWQAMANYITPKLFDPKETQARIEYAKNHQRDFALPLAFRPEGGLVAVMRDKHIEFRFLPSCMQTPESAYVAVGGAELITREVFSTDKMIKRDWNQFVHRMYTDPEVGGRDFLPLNGALAIAEKHVVVPDIYDTWRS